MNTWWDNIRYFKPNEFDSPDAPGSGKNMNRDLIEILEVIRSRVGRSITISSGYRTASYNALPKIGGKPDSAHLRGLAVDIIVENSFARYSILDQAVKNGVRRLGIAKTFLHLDLDPTLPRGVAWLYD